MVILFEITTLEDIKTSFLFLLKWSNFQIFLLKKLNFHYFIAKVSD